MLIDTRGQSRLPDKIRALRPFRHTTGRFEHQGAVLIDGGSIVYLDPRQAERLIRKFIYSSATVDLVGLKDSRRARVVAQAWRAGREWFTCEELRQSVA